jgi:hypothetical protein
MTNSAQPRKSPTTPKRRRWYHSLFRAAAVTTVVVLLLFIAGCLMLHMPGHSYSGPLQPLTPEETQIRDGLKQHVHELAGRIGIRNLQRPDKLEEAAAYVEQSFAALGYKVTAHPFEVQSVQDHTVRNLSVEIPGSTHPAEIVVIGAHYDSARGCPAANDNASGVAAMLELARVFRARAPARTLRFVAFVNEEPPWFQTRYMGSRVYAAECRARNDNIVSMVSIETIGYYSDEKGSQKYPPPFGAFYPGTGNFIAFVGNWSSRHLVSRSIGTFRRHAKFPSEGGAVPGAIPGIGWSDHWAFWQEHYPGIMVTDTAPFRSPPYHEPQDTPDKLDYVRSARVVAGLGHVTDDLVSSKAR